MINDVYHDDHAESSSFNIQVFPQSLVMHSIMFHSFPLQLQNLQSMQHATCLQRAFNVPLRWWLPGRCGPTRKRPKSWPLTRRTPRSWFGWSELSSAGDFLISSFSSFSFSDFLGSFVFFDHLQLLQYHNYIMLYIYIIIVSHLIYPDFRINHGALLAMLIGDKAFRCGFDRTSVTAVELAAPVPGQPLRHSRRGAATHSSLLGKRKFWTKDEEEQGLHIKYILIMCVLILWDVSWDSDPFFRRSLEAQLNRRSSIWPVVFATDNRNGTIAWESELSWSAKGWTSDGSLCQFSLPQSKAQSQAMFLPNCAFAVFLQLISSYSSYFNMIFLIFSIFIWFPELKSQWPGHQWRCSSRRRGAGRALRVPVVWGCRHSYAVRHCGGRAHWNDATWIIQMDWDVHVYSF